RRAGTARARPPRCDRTREGLARAGRGAVVNREASAAARLNGSVGMMVFLGACAMLFAALLFAYAVVRSQATAWPPPGTPAFPRSAAAMNGLLLIASGFALRRAPARGPVWAAGAVGLGALLLLMQATLWGRLVASKLGPGTGALGDAFFALSGF